MDAPAALVVKNQLVLPNDLDKPRGVLKVIKVSRDVSASPITAFAG